MKEAKVNWVTARRAILRKPIDRIGYGGYSEAGNAVPGIHRLCGEQYARQSRTLYDNIEGDDSVLR